MKKINKVLLFITIISILLCTSCLSNEKVLQTDGTLESIDSLVSQTELNFPVYNHEVSTEFNQLIAANPIDKVYYKNYPDNGVTLDMAKYEVQFIEIWKSELEFSIQNLTDLLNNEDKERLMAVQNDWLEWISKSLSFEQELLSNEDYGVMLGSIFLVDQRAAYREAYRARTLQIKYIHYLMETQCLDDKSIGDCQSLQFLYQG